MSVGGGVKALIPTITLYLEVTYSLSSSNAQVKQNKLMIIGFMIIIFEEDKEQMFWSAI